LGNVWFVEKKEGFVAVLGFDMLFVPLSSVDLLN
jgi:hypothetical protein